MCRAAAASCAKGMERQPLLTAAAARVPVDRRANAARAVCGGNAGCCPAAGAVVRQLAAQWRETLHGRARLHQKETVCATETRIFFIKPRGRI